MVERVRDVVIEKHGDLKLVLGGKNGYARVRGGVGPNKDQYQGYTKDKKDTTAAFHTPQEAAIALAELERDLAAGLDKAARKKRKTDACKRLRTSARTHSPSPPCYLHFLTAISYVPACAADQVDADQSSTPTLSSTTLPARLGPYLTTLPFCRRSSAAPLASIDYNVNILAPASSCERLAMAAPPCLLTPAQTALMHALGMAQGRAHTMRS